MNTLSLISPPAMVPAAEAETVKLRSLKGRVKRETLAMPYDYDKLINVNAVLDT